MPGAMNAEELVELTRMYVNTWGQDTFRDGFLRDELDASGNKRECPSILGIINNDATNYLLGTGYRKCVFHQTITPDSGQAYPNEYGLQFSVHEIVRCEIDGIPLDRVTQLEEDTVNSSWQRFTKQTPGRPNRYYNYGDVIGFIPLPDKTYVANFLADATPKKLVDPSDYPESLPGRFHYLLALRAALVLAAIDLENPAAEKRIPEYKQMLRDGIFGIGGSGGGLAEVIQTRGDDTASQINVRDYRTFFRTS